MKEVLPMAKVEEAQVRGWGMGERGGRTGWVWELAMVWALVWALGLAWEGAGGEQRDRHLRGKRILWSCSLWCPQIPIGEALSCPCHRS